MEVVVGLKFFYLRKIKDIKIIWCDLVNGFFWYSWWLFMMINVFESINLWCILGVCEM